MNIAFRTVKIAGVNPQKTITLIMRTNVSRKQGAEFNASPENYEVLKPSSTQDVICVEMNQKE